MRIYRAATTDQYYLEQSTYSHKRILRQILEHNATFQNPAEMAQARCRQPELFTELEITRDSHTIQFGTQRINDDHRLLYATLTYQDQAYYFALDVITHHRHAQHPIFQTKENRQKTVDWLLALVERRHTKNHSTSEATAETAATREPTRFSQTNHHFYVLTQTQAAASQLKVNSRVVALLQGPAGVGKTLCLIDWMQNIRTQNAGHVSYFTMQERLATRVCRQIEVPVANPDTPTNPESPVFEEDVNVTATAADGMATELPEETDALAVVVSSPVNPPSSDIAAVAAAAPISDIRVYHLGALIQRIAEILIDPTQDPAQAVATASASPLSTLQSKSAHAATFEFFQTWYDAQKPKHVGQKSSSKKNSRSKQKAGPVQADEPPEIAITSIDAHQLYAEFTQILITPTSVSLNDLMRRKAYLSEKEYMDLGQDQSYITKAHRPQIYAKFLAYLQAVKKTPDCYEPHVLFHKLFVWLMTLAHESRAKLAKGIGHLAIDEMQNIHPWLLHCLFTLQGPLSGCYRMMLAGDPRQLVNGQRRHVLRPTQAIIGAHGRTYCSSALADNFRCAPLIARALHILQCTETQVWGISETSEASLPITQVSSPVNPASSDIAAVAAAAPISDDKQKLPGFLMQSPELPLYVKENGDYLILIPDELWNAAQATPEGKTQLLATFGPNVLPISQAGGLESRYIVCVGFDALFNSRENKTYLPQQSSQFFEDARSTRMKEEDNKPPLGVRDVYRQFMLAMSRAIEGFMFVGQSAFVKSLFACVALFQSHTPSAAPSVVAEESPWTPEKWLKHALALAKSGNESELTLAENTLFHSPNVWRTDKDAQYFKKCSTAFELKKKIRAAIEIVSNTNYPRCADLEFQRMVEQACAVASASEASPIVDMAALSDDNDWPAPSVQPPAKRQTQGPKTRPTPAPKTSMSTTASKKQPAPKTSVSTTASKKKPDPKPSPTPAPKQQSLVVPLKKLLLITVQVLGMYCERCGPDATTQYSLDLPSFTSFLMMALNNSKFFHKGERTEANTADLSHLQALLSTYYRYLKTLSLTDKPLQKQMLSLCVILTIFDIECLGQKKLQTNLKAIGYLSDHTNDNTYLQTLCTTYQIGKDIVPRLASSSSLDAAQAVAAIGVSDGTELQDDAIVSVDTLILAILSDIFSGDVVQQRKPADKKKSSFSLFLEQLAGRASKTLSLVILAARSLYVLKKTSQTLQQLIGTLEINLENIRNMLQLSCGAVDHSIQCLILTQMLQYFILPLAKKNGDVTRHLSEIFRSYSPAELKCIITNRFLCFDVIAFIKENDSDACGFSALLKIAKTGDKFGEHSGIFLITAIIPNAVQNIIAISQRDLSVRSALILALPEIDENEDTALHRIARNAPAALLDLITWAKNDPTFCICFVPIWKKRNAQGQTVFSSIQGSQETVSSLFMQIREVECLRSLCYRMLQEENARNEITQLFAPQIPMPVSLPVMATVASNSVSLFGSPRVPTTQASETASPPTSPL